MSAQLRHTSTCLRSSQGSMRVSAAGVLAQRPLQCRAAASAHSFAQPCLSELLPTSAAGVCGQTAHTAATRSLCGRAAKVGLHRQHSACRAASSLLMGETPTHQLSDEERSALAERLGYRSIGAQLPEGVTLSKIINSLPKDVFEINPWRAWGAVATSVLAMALSLVLIANAPWYLLPFAWAFSGTAFTGFFVVGHDCGHRSFSKNNLVEDIVGTLAFMPLIFPFEPWRIKHNHHHSHTNKLVEDTAWHPIPKEQMEKWGPVQRSILRTFLGSPLKLWASVGHWAVWHFDVSLYTERQKPKVLVSLAAVAAFAFIALPALWITTGPLGFLKFWLVPWLGYHFWMSTFTVVHHTAPHIPFKPANEWNAAEAQLSGTVHCDYPRWVEFLCHDINVHVPHHVSSKIPWYNLRRATDSLRGNWGKFMTECHWNWRMMRSIFTELHFYDEKTPGQYTAFDHEEEHPFWVLQRKLIPNHIEAPWAPKPLKAIADRLL